MGRLAITSIAALASCDYGAYPLPPTYCDDYCRATERADCEKDEPHRCVVRCELQTRSDRCARQHNALLECLEEAPDWAFYCDYLGESRPLEAQCLAQRQATEDCEFPAVVACTRLCSDYAGQCAENLAQSVDLDQSIGESCQGLCVRLSLQQAEDQVLASYLDCLQQQGTGCGAWVLPEVCGQPPDDLAEILSALGAQAP